MLTPQALERVSQAYRRGYYDGVMGKEPAEHGYPKGTFAEHDYAEGHKAGANDDKWAKRLAKRQA